MAWNSNRSSINGLQVVTGVTTITGSAVTQTFAGISVIERAFFETINKLSGASSYIINVNPGSAYDLTWPSSGVTNIGIQVLDSMGALYGSGISLQYMVLGN